MEYIRDCVTTDGARSSPVQLPRALDACTLVAAWDQGRVNGSIHANAAYVIAYFARPFPSPLHILLKPDQKLAGLLQRSSPFCILWIVLDYCVEELAAVFPDLHDAAMLILDELGKSLQVSRKCLAFCALTNNPCAIPWIVDGNFMIQPPSVLPAPQHTLSQMGRCFPIRPNIALASGYAIYPCMCARPNEFAGMSLRPRELPVKPATCRSVQGVCVQYAH